MGITPLNMKTCLKTTDLVYNFGIMIQCLNPYSPCCFDIGLLCLEIVND